MFFLLSKLLYFLLSPLTWCVIAILIYFLSKTTLIRRWAKIIAIVIFLIFSNTYLYNITERYWQINPIPLHQHVEAGIVLGGLISFNQQHQGFFNGAAERYTAALQLYEAGYIKKIIVSGGSGLLLDTTDKEAIFLRQQFLNAAVPDNAILVEDHSRNTYENALFTKKLIEQNKLQPPFVLITSAEHMRRALAVFHQAGISVIPYPVNYNVLPHGKNNWYDFIIPNLCNFYKWQDLWKEMIGYAVYHITHKL